MNIAIIYSKISSSTELIWQFVIFFDDILLSKQNIWMSKLIIIKKIIMKLEKSITWLGKCWFFLQKL